MLYFVSLAQGSQDNDRINTEILNNQSNFIQIRETQKKLHLEFSLFTIFACTYGTIAYFEKDSSFSSKASLFCTAYASLLLITVANFVHEKNKNKKILHKCSNDFSSKQIKNCHKQLLNQTPGNLSFDHDFFTQVLQYQSEHLEDRMKTNKIMQSVGALITQGGAERQEGCQRNGLLTLTLGRFLADDDSDFCESSQSKSY